MGVKNKSDPALTEVREEVELCWNLLYFLLEAMYEN